MSNSTSPAIEDAPQTSEPEETVSFGTWLLLAITPQLALLNVSILLLISGSPWLIKEDTCGAGIEFSCCSGGGVEVNRGSIGNQCQQGICIRIVIIVSVFQIPATIVTCI